MALHKLYYVLRNKILNGAITQVNVLYINKYLE